MIVVRNNVFETNSSSTHSLTMCMKDTYSQWKEGNLFYVKSLNDFVNKEERDELLKRLIIRHNMVIDYQNKTITYKDITVNYDNYEDKKMKIEQFFTLENFNEITNEDIEKFYDEEFDNYEFPLTYDEYNNSLEYYETYCEEYTTSNGDTVVAFGSYGNDY